MCSSETIILKEEKRSSIMAVQMDNLRALNARVREMCGVAKLMD